MSSYIILLITDQSEGVNLKNHLRLKKHQQHIIYKCNYCIYK